MPIRLVITNNELGASEPKDFDQEVINLGRTLYRNETEKNDVVLPVKYASKAHAQILLDKENYYLIDESRHGTSLNGRRLQHGEKVVLQDGDCIGICEPALATITVNLIESLAGAHTLIMDEPPRSVADGESTASQIIEAAGAKPAAPDTASAPAASQNIPQTAQTLAQALDQTYSQHAALDAAQRKEALKQTLRAQMGRWRREDQVETLSLIKQRFPNQANDVESLIRENTALKTEVAEWRGKQELARATYDEMVTLVQALLDGGKSFQSENELHAFCGNVKQTLTTLLEAFWDLDHIRREILLEWLDIIDEQDEITPLQTAKSSKEFGNYLLDWDGKKDSRKAVATLEKGLGNLATHERALLNAYDNGIWVGSRKLLDILDPQVLEHEIGNKQIGFGPLKIPLKALGPLLRLFVWKEYAKRFAELKGEERSMIRTLFEEGFKEGYKGEVKKRRAGDMGEVQTKILRRKSERTGLRKV